MGGIVFILEDEKGLAQVLDIAVRRKKYTPVIASTFSHATSLLSICYPLPLLYLLDVNVPLGGTSCSYLQMVDVGGQFYDHLVFQKVFDVYPPPLCYFMTGMCSPHDELLAEKNNRSLLVKSSFDFFTKLMTF